MKKGVKIFLIVLAALAIMGVCFGCIGIYAKNQMNKPKFQMPVAEAREPVAPLPQSKEEAVAYVNELFAEAVAAPDSEVSLKTDVDLGGDMELPFSEADNNIIRYIRDHASGDIAALYPQIAQSNITELDGAEYMKFDAADVSGFTAERGHTDEDGNVTDEDYYFITLTFDVARETHYGIKSGSVYDGVVEALPGVTVVHADFTPKELVVNCKINCIYNQMENLDLSKANSAYALISFTGEEYAPMKDAYGDEVELTLPYRVTERFSFLWYGARFEDRVIAVNPNDMEALPAKVTVHPEATEGDYTLTFKEDKEGFMDIDPDGVMNVHKEVTGDDPVTVTMTLDYNGKIYEDKLLVYITDLEVENNGEQQY